MGNRDSKGWHMSLNISFLGSFSAQLSNLIYCCVKFGCGSFVCLSVCLLACLPACLFVCLFVSLFVSLFVHKVLFSSFLVASSKLVSGFLISGKACRNFCQLILEGCPICFKKTVRLNHFTCGKFQVLQRHHLPQSHQRLSDSGRGCHPC